jgi:hypothetical protein
VRASGSALPAARALRQTDRRASTFARPPRAQARRLEGELEVKLQALTKLCSGFESSYRSRQQEDRQGVGTDQVRATPAQAPRRRNPPGRRRMREGAAACARAAPAAPALPNARRPRAHRPPSPPQLAQARASEIVALLRRLSDVNDEMGGVIGGGSDGRAHTLARHRDVLQEYTQVRGAGAWRPWGVAGAWRHWERASGRGPQPRGACRGRRAARQPRARP